MIIARSPLRISFAGGGTDLPGYYEARGFGAVCSMAINKYIYVTANNLSAFFPHRFRIAYSQTELTQDAEDIRHPIVRAALKLHGIDGGIDINIMADIPAGTGMGSSSCFTVTLLHALHAARGRLVSREDLAAEASEIEIKILNEPIGKQDQYAAALGGFNLFKFHSHGRVDVEPLPLPESKREQLLQHLMLFYLGGSRSASAILKEQNKNTGDNFRELDLMRDQATQFAHVLVNSSRIQDLGELLQEGWKLKKSLASGVSNTEIDEIMTRAESAGATGGKLLGAGGTGFVLLFAKPEHHAKIRSALHPLSEVSFKDDHLGSTLLYYGN